MTRHRKPNCLARWVFRIGVTVCALIVVVSVVSFRWEFLLNAGNQNIRLDHCVVSMWKGPTRGANVIILPASGEFTLVPKVPSYATWRDYPTWVFVLAALIPTVVAWRKLHRNYLPGHCRKCGYNLTGNVTGVCSECGMEIESKGG